MVRALINGFWVMWCMVLLSAVGAVNYPPPAGDSCLASPARLVCVAVDLS